jgi:hypothetical protein
MLQHVFRVVRVVVLDPANFDQCCLEKLTNTLAFTLMSECNLRNSGEYSCVTDAHHTAT